jgi:hypothetical protein
LAVAQHLPRGRHQAGDRHLKFHEDRDNLPKSFRRDVEHARAFAEVATATDASAWIGEWHTHLEALPEPSDFDLHTYRTLLSDPETAFPRLLALILLADPTHGWDRPVLHAWSFTGTVLRQLPVSGLPKGAQLDSREMDTR